VGARGLSLIEFDRGGEILVPILDRRQVRGELPNASNTRPESDVALVEDEIPGWCVVSDLIWLRVIPLGHASIDKGRRRRPIFSTRLKSLNVRVSGSWSARDREVALVQSTPVTTWSLTNRQFR
jgi:hypothetical protein